MSIHWRHRLIVVLGLLALGVACSPAAPEGTGPLSSGTPGATTSSSSTSSSATPSDVSDPATVTPPAEPVCGNGTQETGEQCDDGNVISNDGCSSICKTESCGDGIVQSGLNEECDGTNLNSSTCATLGFSTGTLTCSSLCKFNKSNCSTPAPTPTPVCGDGVVQSGLGEECDGSNLNGSSCLTFGYTVGSISCGGTCKFVKTGCSAVCGNNVKETGEQCDDGNILSWDGCTSTCQNEAVPTLVDHFTTSTNATWSVKDPYGTVTFAATDTLASDQKIAKITFTGGQTDAAGPGNSTEIYTKSLLGFGMYRARFNFVKCATGEDLTSGIFVYSRGGSDGLPVDSNGNGIKDNNEIDIELWCGNSKKLYMTTWTDYQDIAATETQPAYTIIKKVSRVIDLSTGKAYETPAGKEGTYDVDYKTVKETIPEMVLPTLATDDAYYEMGFEWHSNSLRYFIVLNGKEVTLWNYTDTTYIPQNKVKMMFNVWYPDWSGKAYPASDQSLKVDWFKYWAN